MRKADLISFAAGAAFLAFASTASAQNALRLTWDAPPECPSEQAVLEEIEGLTRGAPVTPLEARVQVRSASAIWSAELTTSGGSRVLRGNSCAEVTHAVAVILALAMAPEAALPAPALPPTTRSGQFEPSPAMPFREAPARSPTTEPVAAVPSRAVPERASPVVAPTTSVRPDEDQHSAARPSQAKQPVAAVSPPAPTEALPANRALRLGASARLLGDLGTLPGRAVGAAVGVRLSTQRVLAELSALALLPREKLVATPAGEGVKIGWQAVRIDGCGAPSAGSRFLGCVSFDAGRLSGVGVGADHVNDVGAWWLAPGVGALVRLLGGRSFSLEARVGLALPLLRPAFGLQSSSVVARPAVLSGRMEIGIGWR